MRRRTLSREFALQILYRIDVTKDSVEESLSNFWQARAEEQVEPSVQSFSQELVKGVADNLGEIDKKIAQHATNWQLKRMAVIDRNILRMGCFELLFRSDIPTKVSINEAVELAKKYSGLESGKFVNGVLDNIKLERP